MGVCGLSSGRPCPFALRVWQAWADRWPPLSIPLQSNTVTGFSSAVDLATASQQSRLARGLLNRRVMKSSAAHMIIKALTLGGLSEALHPSPLCHWCSQSSTRIVIRYTVLWKTTVVRRKESYNSFQSSFLWEEGGARFVIPCNACQRSVLSDSFTDISETLSRRAESRYTELDHICHLRAGADSH